MSFSMGTRAAFICSGASWIITLAMFDFGDLLPDSTFLFAGADITAGFVALLGIWLAIRPAYSNERVRSKRIVCILMSGIGLIVSVLVLVVSGPFEPV